MNSIWCHIDKIARQRMLSMMMMAILSFGGSWALSLIHGIPTPFIQDEFSYLLAGDTFAHGRITNPTPVLWEHFETFHELMKPSYMSKYPPGQGFFLALGEVLFGHPIFGVWVSVGLMCAAICWMLYAWVSPRWAFVGGLVAVLQFGIFTYWSQSYWGGAVAAMGGALVFGAVPRIFKLQRTRDALWLGIGIAILLNTRPFEGIVLSIPVGMVVLEGKIRWRGIVLSRFIKKIILPLGLCLIVTAGFEGYYNKQITGNALVFPYQVYTKTYSAVPMFIWQPLRPPVHFNNAVMKEYEYGWTIRRFLIKRTWTGFWKSTLSYARFNFLFYFGYPLAFVPLSMLMLMRVNWRRICTTVIVVMMFLFAFHAIYCPGKPHYYAPFTCLVVLLLAEGLRALSTIKLKETRIGLIIITLLIIFQAGANILTCPSPIFVRSLAKAVNISNLNLPDSFTRQQLIDILKKRGGKYLVIVKNPPWYSFHWEWVYNDADIGHSPVVWARDLGIKENAKLLAYYKDRCVCYIAVIWDMDIRSVTHNISR